MYILGFPAKSYDFDPFIQKMVDILFLKFIFDKKMLTNYLHIVFFGNSSKMYAQLLAYILVFPPTTFTCLTTKWRTDEFSNSSFLKFVFKINFSSVFGRKLPKFQNNAY